jgi:HNH endonuclease
MRESLKKAVRQRAKFCCEYCLAQILFSADVFSIEHILPLSKGGLTVLINLAFSCQCCNNHKYTATQAFDPLSGAMAQLYNPRTDVWAEHFKWDDDFIEILGISPIGRATVTRLHLNREGLLNLRRVLVQAGFHPPL